MNGLRMPNLNSLTISGRLTRDPELKYTQSGVPVFKGRMANNTFFKSADGEWKTETAYTGFVAWQALAERCYENLKKGSAIIVSGRLSSSEWETTEGEKRSQIEVRADRVQFLDRTSVDDGAEMEGSDPESDQEVEEVEG